MTGDALVTDQRKPLDPRRGVAWRCVAWRGVTYKGYGQLAVREPFNIQIRAIGILGSEVVIPKSRSHEKWNKPERDQSRDIISLSLS